MEVKIKVLLRSELTYLEACARLAVNFNESDASATAVIPAQLVEEMAQRCKEFKELMLREVFSPAKDQAIRRYVQFHQAGLVVLSDELFAGLRHITGPAVPGKSELLLSMLELVEEVLSYLEKQFYAYFDPRHPLSSYHCDAVSRELRTAIEELAPLLSESGIGSSLKDVFLHSMDDALTRVRIHGADRGQVDHLYGLNYQIRQYLLLPTVDDRSFQDLLYRHNFNSTQFESRLRAQFQSELAAGRQPDLLPIDRETGLVAGRRPLDILLKEWYAMQNGTALAKGKARTLKMLRLPLHLSVPQLALFARLCYLEGCFQITNISTIMRFFTEHFETKKQLDISLKSFGKAFYAADQSSAAAVRDYLQRMIGLIDKNYFPKT
ncbi:hypothetical protein DJ568_02935 [Mucilaginibacter hurinus]|uniref:Uncharacterized protein n=1 Tax=Mucilaginibacter hurinus TaxID=2201324 RepID=A0A367GVG7_9SPHI|nr:hypothetical protein [Mucilaginibacter hurinus]RCH56826.1 hypothetical protein DJ568_02935 [Mucilaginibacter hurinus]